MARGSDEHYSTCSETRNDVRMSDCSCSFPWCQYHDSATFIITVSVLCTHTHTRRHRDLTIGHLLAPTTTTKYTKHLISKHTIRLELDKIRLGR